jgi:hypothetical protein
MSKRVKTDKKRDLQKYVLGLEEELFTEVVKSLEDTVLKVKKFFSNK